MKASPAPEESTACTGGAGMCSQPSSTTTTPRSPIVTSTAFAPRFCRISAAVFASSGDIARWPVSSSTSVSFGMQRSVRRSSSSDSETAGAGLRIVRTPAARARRNASRVVSIGTSNWHSTKLDSRISDSAARTPSGVRAALAPGTMRIQFCPLSSTRIAAVPVGCSASRNTCVVSMPCCLRLCRVCSPKTSLPTRAIMATLASRRPAITA